MPFRDIMGKRRPTESLPPRVKPVLKLLLRGLSEKQVSAELGLTPSTVHQYTKIIYRKLDVHSRGELLARWIEKAERGR